MWQIICKIIRVKECLQVWMWSKQLSSLRLNSIWKRKYWNFKRKCLVKRTHGIRVQKERLAEGQDHSDLKIFFWCGPFLKSNWICYNIASGFFFIVVVVVVNIFWLQGMWDLSSQIKDWAHNPCIGRQNLNHWTTREVPGQDHFG